MRPTTSGCWAATSLSLPGSLPRLYSSKRAQGDTAKGLPIPHPYCLLRRSFVEFPVQEVVSLLQAAVQ